MNYRFSKRFSIIYFFQFKRLCKSLKTLAVPIHFKRYWDIFSFYINMLFVYIVFETSSARNSYTLVSVTLTEFHDS